ncbi:MAG: helix-turn-helix domain-containing protein [Sedimentisphaerales bacterium]|nr:helix-turn-helix domain-containing protein [Sedimentisphaerales bacterium]
MAGMFYNLQEVVEKLGKTDVQIKEMVREGKLREFRDGSKLLFKVEEVDKLAEERAPLDLTAADEIAKADAASSAGSELDLSLDETGDIQLSPEEDTGPADDLEGLDLTGLGDLTKADTNVESAGISVLAETDDGYKLASDTKGETVAEGETEDILGDLDDDMNLESVGSGSGLLDLSLQADDTSLGAVLDDILPTGPDEQSEGSPADDLALMDEGEEVFEAPAAPVPAPIAAAAPAAPVVAAPGRAVAMVYEPEPTGADNACGITLFIGMAAILITAIVTIAAFRGIRPSLLTSLEGTAFAGIPLVWVVAGGLAILMILILLIGAMLGKKRAA